MGRKQKSTAITNKTTPEQNKAILILLDSLKQLDSLKINKIKEEYLHSGFKGFLSKKISKSMIPKGTTWAWNQSNARIIYPLSPSVTVTLFKLNPRRLTPAPPSSAPISKLHSHYRHDDDDDDDDDDDHPHYTKKIKLNKRNIDEDEDDEESKPSYKLWIYQLNLHHNSNSSNSVDHSLDQSKAKKKKSNGKHNKKNNSTMSHLNNNNSNLSSLTSLIENNNNKNNDNFLISFVWCEKGRSPPSSSPTLPHNSPVNHDLSPHHNNNSTNNTPKYNESFVDHSSPSMVMNNIHLNNLNNINTNMNNNTKKNGDPAYLHLNQKMNINYNTIHNSEFDDYYDFQYQNNHSNNPSYLNNNNQMMMNNNKRLNNNSTINEDFDYANYLQQEKMAKSFYQQNQSNDVIFYPPFKPLSQSFNQFSGFNSNNHFAYNNSVKPYHLPHQPHLPQYYSEYDNTSNYKNIENAYKEIVHFPTENNVPLDDLFLDSY